MSPLVYSDNAENILPKFYDVDILVYVEGKRDIQFWSVVLNKTSTFKFQCLEVSGASNLHPYICRIKNESLKAIVACDADFSYIENFPCHQNILRTYGYSIENSLINDKSLQRIIGFQSPDTKKNIKLWLEHIFELTKDLVIHAIVNHKCKYGNKVISDCNIFMKDQTSPKISKVKIEKYIEELAFSISTQTKNNIEQVLKTSKRTISDLLKGHFLLTASRKYVLSILKSKTNKPAISLYSFEKMLDLAFEVEFNENHSHFAYYDQIVKNIKI